MQYITTIVQNLFWNYLFYRIQKFSRIRITGIKKIRQEGNSMTESIRWIASNSSVVPYYIASFVLYEAVKRVCAATLKLGSVFLFYSHQFIRYDRVFQKLLLSHLPVVHQLFQDIQNIPWFYRRQEPEDWAACFVYHELFKVPCDITGSYRIPKALTWNKLGRSWKSTSFLKKKPQKLFKIGAMVLWRAWQSTKIYIHWHLLWHLWCREHTKINELD